MLRFFRTLRHKLLEEDNFRKYVWYAVGEILLVVIGILIALQINNWNEARKDNQRKAQYVQSLLTDLRQDALELEEEISILNEDYIFQSNLISRLSNSSATIDTALQIARYEFHPFFDPSNELNRNTISTLIATGDINLFSETDKNALLALNKIQIDGIAYLNKNADIFLDIWIGNRSDLGPTGRSEQKHLVVTGKQADIIWQNIDEASVLNRLSDVITSKLYMLLFSRDRKTELLDATNELIFYLNDQYPELN